MNRRTVFKNKNCFAELIEYPIFFIENKNGEKTIIAYCYPEELHSVFQRTKELSAFQPMIINLPQSYKNKVDYFIEDEMYSIQFSLPRIEFGIRERAEEIGNGMALYEFQQGELKSWLEESLGISLYNEIRETSMRLMEHQLQCLIKYC
jgi:hypothetical protein